MRYEIIIAGSGGQGVMLIATVMAEAVASSDGYFVTQVQNYDPAVRGGKADSNLVISNQEVDYPGILSADILLALNQGGYERNIQNLRADGFLVVDSDNVVGIEWNRVLRVPFVRTARNKFSNLLVANMIALGVLTSLSRFISTDAVKAAISSSVSKEALDLNLEAFQEGIYVFERQEDLGFEQIKPTIDIEL
ncbi:2-oxoacid:acceptor oxidoreductase family protein [Chloroflexota bacterium]